MTVHELGDIAPSVKDIERSGRDFRDVLGRKEIEAPEGRPATRATES